MILPVRAVIAFIAARARDGYQHSGQPHQPAQERAGLSGLGAFYYKYNAVLISIARKLDLDDDSALDVLQQAMMVVMRRSPSFDYNPDLGCCGGCAA